MRREDAERIPHQEHKDTKTKRSTASRLQGAIFRVRRATESFQKGKATGIIFCVEMKREIRVFNSFAEAEEADYEYYRSLTGDEKLELMLKIMAPAYEANPRFERVYRVVERSSR